MRQIAAVAAELLLCQRTRRLRVDPRTLTYPHPISFDTTGNYCKYTRQTFAGLVRGINTHDGFTLMFGRGADMRYLILYHETAHKTRLAFTLAHEVGHICLRHRDDSRAREREANEFAAELLAPRVLLWELRRRGADRLSPERVCDVFLISRQAAALQIGAIPDRDAFSAPERRLLREYGGLLPSPNEPLLS